MKRTALASILAVSLTVSLGAALSALAARPGDIVVPGRDPELRSSPIIATAQMRDITLRVDRRREG